MSAAVLGALVVLAISPLAAAAQANGAGDELPELAAEPAMEAVCRGLLELEREDFTDLVAGPGFERGALSFAVRFGREISPYRLMSFSILPGEEIEIEPRGASTDDDFTVCAQAGELQASREGRWRWKAAAEPGIYRLAVHEHRRGETMWLNAMVMRPYAGQGKLDGFHIGQYQPTPLRGNPVYALPKGLIEVTADNRSTWLSPHFRLEQFLCKQTSGYPRFVLVRARLLLKLEAILGHLNESGVATPTLTVMSAYRTPQYNQAIGNTTSYSRHLYGDAADVFVDNDQDGRLDDLNGDGVENLADAKLLFDLVERATAHRWYQPFIGGLGLYGPKSHRGGFIHVDTRGFKARW